MVFRALIVSPYFLLSPPVWYLGGVAAIAVFYGLYYRLMTHEKDWYKGIFFTLFYVTLLLDSCRTPCSPSAIPSGAPGERPA